MNLQQSLGVILVLIAVCGGSACAPIPTTVYAADSAQGKLLFSTCAINKNVPGGIELELDGVLAQVKLDQAFSRGFVEVRLDVPPNRTVQLLGDVVAVDRHDGREPIEAHYPNISLVDAPSINSFNGSPALAQYMLPVQTPMVGGAMVIGRQVWPKHYWMAARVDTEGARAVTVTLPRMIINGTPARFPDLHFHRKFVIVLAPINC